MNETLKRYGDTWVVAALISLAAAAVVVWKPSITLLQGIGLLVASFIVASVVSFVTTRLLSLFKKETILLNDRIREFAIVFVLVALLGVPFIAWFRGRPVPVPKSSVTPQEIQEIVTATTTAPDGTPRRVYPLVDKILERQENLKNEVLANGTNAKAAATEMQQNDEWLDKIRKHRKQPRPASPSSPQGGQQTAPAPPPPPVSPITRDNNETDLSILRKLITGPAGQWIEMLLGLAGGGGYERQVRIAVEAMRGNTAPTAAQVQGVLDAVGGTANDTQTKLAALKTLEQIGGTLLDGAQFRELQARLAAARNAITTPVSEQILARLRRPPRPTPAELLSYLPNEAFASRAQKDQVRQALVANGFRKIWTEVFAELPVN